MNAHEVSVGTGGTPRPTGWAWRTLDDTRLPLAARPPVRVADTTTPFVPQGVPPSFLIYMVVAVIAGCGQPPVTSQPITIAERSATMGTTYTVKVSALPPGRKVAQLAKEIEAELAAVNDMMSTWQADSELSRFNGSEETDWFAVSPAVVEVVAEAERISQLSGGAFDVTVGPLVNLWGFGPEGTREKVPSEEEIEQTRPRIGFGMLQFRAEPAALKKDRADLYVDLSAIAKGYAVDRVAAYLQAVGVEGYMVEIGGEVKTRGKRPDGEGWRIGIARPSVARGLQAGIVPGDRGMATSGDYHNYFERDGKRYSHTIDPRTGAPITHRLASVTVLHESCMVADAVATAIMVLGPDAGFELAKAQDLPALLIVRDGDDFVEQATPAFVRMTAESGEQR